MKNILYFLFFITVSYKVTAQITYIPDPAFEQSLINLNIDSDGVVNGQVLTSDVESVVELEIFGHDYYGLSDLTGIQDFTSLEKLSITFSEITELDVSQNLQLKELDCSSNWLTSIDVSSNTLLEVLWAGNVGGDVGPFNEIEEIDLSNNPNIHTLNLQDLYYSLKRINLRNGNNNSNLTINIGIYPWTDDPDYDPTEIYNTVCIEVDDEQLAQNNQYPYSDWHITHYHTAYIFTDNMIQCSLGTPSFSQSNIKVYPNPVSDVLYFETTDTIIEKVMVFDLSGRKVLEQNDANTISVLNLQKGNYIIKILSDKGIQTEKIIVK